MSRSGYTDDCDQNIYWINWRGAVKSAIRGKRGQAFLQEMLQAMAALPERKLIDTDLERDGAVCAIGAVGRARGVDMSKLDPEDRETVAATFGISPALAAEIVYMNDEVRYKETPEERFDRMRRWVESELYDPASSSLTSKDAP
jgi:hypothetical protein